MSFEWHGRDDNRSLVWENVITRWHFRSDEEVILPSQFGPRTALRKGEQLKLTKAEARKFFSKGVVEWRTHQWVNGKHETVTIQLSKGTLWKDIETRTLNQYLVDPDELKPPKRKKK